VAVLNPQFANINSHVLHLAVTAASLMTSHSLQSYRQTGPRQSVACPCKTQTEDCTIWRSYEAVVALTVRQHSHPRYDLLAQAVLIARTVNARTIHRVEVLYAVAFDRSVRGLTGPRQYVARPHLPLERFPTAVRL
jgi:type II secretory pathway component PulL